MNFKKVTFASSSGVKLAARIDFPADERPAAFALFAHCFTCTKNLKAVGHISRALAKENIAVLRFDFTGLGESEGDFSDTNLSSNVADLLSAAQYLEDSHKAPRLLIGHSLGGVAVLQAAGDIPSAKAVVTIGTPADPKHVKRLLVHGKDEIEARGEIQVVLAGRPFHIKKQFIEDLDRSDIKATLGRLNKALLILHSPIDTIVGIENAAQIFQAARHPKSFVSLDQADHLLSDQTDSIYAGAVIAAWVKKYISDRQSVLSLLQTKNAEF